MFGVCFYHTDFDRDVSSGTLFSMQQWSELLNAFNIKNVAVINLTEDKTPYQEYKTLEEFEKANSGNIVFTKASGTMDFREVNYSEIDWLVFGTHVKWSCDGISVPTFEKKELYPREAAAIILAEASWRTP